MPPPSSSLQCDWYFVFQCLWSWFVSFHIVFVIILCPCWWSWCDVQLYQNTKQKRQRERGGAKREQFVKATHTELPDICQNHPNTTCPYVHTYQVTVHPCDGFIICLNCLWIPIFQYSYISKKCKQQIINKKWQDWQIWQRRESIEKHATSTTKTH